MLIGLSNAGKEKKRRTVGADLDSSGKIHGA
jgi:hypothetical protein